jgi:hypothetical protein
LYFATSDAGGGDVLVPDLRYLARSLPNQSLVTPIVRMLLRGPSPWLAPAVHTLLPRNTALRSNVSLQNKEGDQVQDVVVDLSPEVESAKARELNAFAAEAAWSLRPYFSGELRLQVSGRPLAVDGVPAVQGADRWTSYNPIAQTSVALFYISRGGLRRFNEVAARGAAPDPQVGGAIARAGVRSAALSGDGAGMALVKSAAGGLQTLWVGDPQGDLRATRSGHQVSRPTWGHSSEKVLAAVDGVLYEVDQLGRVQPVVVMPPRPLGPIRAIRLAVDGTRLALVAGDDAGAGAYLGLFQQSTATSRPTLRALRRLPTTVPRLQDIGWSEPTKVVVAGQGLDGTPQVHEMTVDGAHETVTPRTGLRAARLTIAASPQTRQTFPLLYVEAGGHLYQANLRIWADQADIPDVHSPFYPG